MTGSRRFAPAMFATLTLTALGLACAIGTASARDPALIGGSSHNDPANVQSRNSRYAAPARSAPPAYNPYARRPAPQAAAGSDTGPVPPEDAVRQIQALMSQLNSSSGGADGGGQQANYERSMQQARSLMARNNNQFSASTRAVFLELQALDAELQRDRNSNPGLYDGSHPEAGLDNGMQRAENGMNRLNDVLMPMLQDMKQAWDTELRNAANKRRP
jgi:hypothetical protein